MQPRIFTPMMRKVAAGSHRAIWRARYVSPLMPCFKTTLVRFAAVLLIPLPALHAAEVAVSSLDLSLAANTSGWAPRANLSTSGKAISLGGTVFANGLGSHTKFRLVIDCHGTAKRFTAKVGVNDAANKKYAAVVFRVEGDGRKIFMSPVMRPGDAPLPVDVDLSGIKQLVLLAWNGEGGGQADDQGTSFFRSLFGMAA